MSAEPPGGSPVTMEEDEGGAVWRLEIGGSRGNIIDGAVMAALEDAFARAARDPHLKAIVLQGHGGHFSFGASVQEHLPGRVDPMLRSFHALVRAMLACPVVLLAAVRGQCLGGGLELVTLCHRIFASPDARLGQPEIALGVFAPVASLLLAERVGRPHAEDLCLTGRLVAAHEALAFGLVDEIVPDPAAHAVQYARTHLLGRSASSLRHAVQAVRHELVRRVDRVLPEIEALYLERLMHTTDAVEGLQAFLERRAPRWTDA